MRETPIAINLHLHYLAIYIDGGECCASPVPMSNIPVQGFSNALNVMAVQVSFIRFRDRRLGGWTFS